MTGSTRPTRPGWPEMLTGLLGFAVLLLAFAVGFSQLPPNRPELLGIVGSTAGGIAGVGAFVVAYGVRLIDLEAFGLRRTSRRWLLIGAGSGIVAYGLSYVIQRYSMSSFGGHDPQAILHAAAQGGTVSFIASLLGGAVFTPLGEEALFRGVVANALSRYGAWAGVGASSVIFGLAHGLSVITPLAVMIGVFAAILFRRTGSIWPGFALHGIYNGSNSVASALGFAPMQ